MRETNNLLYELEKQYKWAALMDETESFWDSISDREELIEDNSEKEELSCDFETDDEEDY